MALIPQVQAALRDQGYEHVALAPMWAALWTIPISQVASLLEDLRDPSVAMLLEGQLTMINNNFPKFLKICKSSYPLPDGWLQIKLTPLLFVERRPETMIVIVTVTNEA